MLSVGVAQFGLACFASRPPTGIFALRWASAIRSSRPKLFRSSPDAQSCFISSCLWGPFYIPSLYLSFESFESLVAGLVFSSNIFVFSVLSCVDMCDWWKLRRWCSDQCIVRSIHTGLLAQHHLCDSPPKTTDALIFGDWSDICTSTFWIGNCTLNCTLTLYFNI